VIFEVAVKSFKPGPLRAIGLDFDTEKHFDDHALIEPTDTPRSQAFARRRSVASAQALALVLGALLLVYVIRAVGVQPIFAALSRVALVSFWSWP